VIFPIHRIKITENGGPTLSGDVEVNELDLRYEKQRLRSSAREKQLLLSIMDVGIKDALMGVVEPNGLKILLDGFKRLRCAQKIGLQIVPFQSLGEDEATAIINMLRKANQTAMSFIEQAIFVEELRSVHGLSVSEIARRLERSQAWVSVRVQSFSQMGEATKASIISGAFPAYSYFYTLLPFRRVNGSGAKSDVDEFVGLTAGKSLGTREIEMLASGFFRGGEEMKKQLRSGDLAWVLEGMRKRKAESQSAELNEAENRCVRELEIIGGCMGRLGMKLPGIVVTKPAFLARADLLADQILSKVNPFTKVLKEFYDRCRQAKGDPSS
jgi:hypothetical protein